MKKFFLTWLFLVIVFTFSACGKEDDVLPNDEHPQDQDVPLLTGWHLRSGALHPPEKLYFDSQTMNQETIRTIVTFIQETEGDIIVHVLNRFDGVHGNATTSEHSARYLWDSPASYIPPAERASFTFNVLPILNSSIFYMTAHSSFPYTGEIDPHAHTYALNANGSGTYMDFVYGPEAETLLTSVFQEGEAGQIVTIRINFSNGFIGGIYWYYTYEWIDGDNTT